MIAPVLTVRRYARVYAAVVVQAVRRDTQFRAQAWTTGLVAVAEMIIGLVPVLVVTGAAGRAGINGWSTAEMITVAGCFQVTLGLLNTFVAPNVIKLSTYVQRGELDGLLLRPLDAQWTTLFRWLSPASMAGVLGGIVVVIIGSTGMSIQAGNWLWALLEALLWFGCGWWLVVLLWLNLAYLAFWLEAATFIHDLVLESLTAGRYPVAFFPAAVRIALIFVVPIGVATTLPVEALTCGVHPSVAAGVLAVVVLGTLSTRLHWRLAVRRYASASS